MAITSPYAGTSGRVKMIAISPNLASNNAVTPVGVPVTVNDFKDWSISHSRQGEAGTMTLESPTNNQGIMYKEPVSGGTADWSVTINGLVQNTLVNYQMGQFLVVDLLFFKGVNAGYLSVLVEITNIGPKTGVQMNTAEFSIEAKGFGVLTPTMPS